MKIINEFLYKGLQVSEQNYDNARSIVFKVPRSGQASSVVVSSERRNIICVVIWPNPQSNAYTFDITNEVNKMLLETDALFTIGYAMLLLLSGGNSIHEGLFTKEAIADLQNKLPVDWGKFKSEGRTVIELPQ